MPYKDHVWVCVANSREAQDGMCGRATPKLGLWVPGLPLIYHRSGHSGHSATSVNHTVQEGMPI